LADIFADFAAREKAKMSQWNLPRVQAGRSAPKIAMCNSFVPCGGKTDFHRLRQGLHAELTDAADAKCARPAAGPNVAVLCDAARMARQAVFSALVRTAIPLAKRVSDCFKSFRLRRQ
jgi:hypothetical protein